MAKKCLGSQRVTRCLQRTKAAMRVMATHDALPKCSTLKIAIFFDLDR